MPISTHTTREMEKTNLSIHVGKAEDLYHIKTETNKYHYYIPGEVC